MRYRLVVWDFDGTLADTLALAVATFNDLAARHGFLPIQDAASVRGMTARVFLRQHAITLVRVPWLLAEYMAATHDRMPAVRLFDGLPELLGTLEEAGLRLGVLSSNSAENITSCLRANGVDGLFGFVVGYRRLFGKARGLRQMLRQEAVEPDQVLYVGDEVRDIKAAKRAGMDSAAVTWGFHTRELLERYSPTFLWSRPDEVLAALGMESP